MESSGLQTSRLPALKSQSLAHARQDVAGLTRGIDAVPADFARIVILLRAGDFRAGVGRIAAPAANATKPGLKRQFESDAFEGNAGHFRD
jgi:hypothetical protein